MIKDQKALGLVKRVSEWDTGGDVIVDIVELKDGQVLGITEDSVVLYESMEDLEIGELKNRPEILL